ncbi:phenazine biosynthesis protein PhzF family [Abditibacterium utsteinense]|uniref:Phenazine biosynthesis protein PhzF family n=1 Tax=Abditibacterium utsteinense TaxID=1960156 RepID=A0A2S8SS07_9BACT|nr:PhzF family phenazine biosynthesis protein [Abditibacterium utsteinense]PQV63593.1 phenazine biosynthesis protein PhzF family [Abditibacterium utsteinense]
MNEIPIFIVDAFIGNLAARPLRGNPAAVVHLPAPRDAAWMQGVAAEMNLSETAFVVTKNEGETDFDLRWFTPFCEVKLCGHATLASAHTLWETGQVAHDQILRFHTLSGVLSAKNEDGCLWLDFPAQLPKILAAPPDLALALGLSPREPVAFFKAGEDFLLGVPRGAVPTLRPDFLWLRQISLQLQARGIIVTAQNPVGENGYDFVSRFFAPSIGVNEDPVTGSAHAALAPFWGAQLEKAELRGFQASPRGGLVRVVWRNSRVDLGGNCATFLRGTLEN